MKKQNKAEQNRRSKQIVDEKNKQLLAFTCPEQSMNQLTSNRKSYCNNSRITVFFSSLI